MDRSIPAWAGEPPGQRETKALEKVYPRVGGGAQKTYIDGQRDTGLSPRGRGSQEDDHARPSLHGSIPAWAGEPRVA